MTEQQNEQQGEEAQPREAQEEAPYIAPNSGASPQPGGSVGPAVPGEEPRAQESASEPTSEGAEGSEGPREGSSPVAPDQSGEQEFDPSQHSGDEVMAYVEQHPDQRAKVLAAEKAGENRVTVVRKLERG